MRMPVRPLRMGLILLLCWRICDAQESKPDWGRTAIVATNFPLGFALIHELSVHRFQGLTPHAPHWRPYSIPDGSHGYDVTGNALYCYVITRTLRHGYEYAGFSPFPAALISGINTLL